MKTSMFSKLAKTQGKYCRIYSIVSKCYAQYTQDHYYAYWLEPINHELTLEHMEIYYVGEEAANSKKFKSLREQNHKQWEDIQKEDVDIIQGMQIGRNSPVYNGGNFSPVMDNPTHHFHKWVVNNIV